MKTALVLVLLLASATANASEDLVTTLNNRSGVYAQKCIPELSDREKAVIRDRNKFQATAELEIMLAAGQKAAECYGFIEGYIVGRNSGGSKQFCLPTDVGVSEIAEMFVTTVRAKPELKNTPKDVMLETILRSNWPCTSNGT